MTQIEFTHKLIGLQENLQYYANMLTSNREEAKDLIQDTYLKALANRDKFADWEVACEVYWIWSDVCEVDCV